MPQLGPHISVSDEQLLTRAFGLMDMELYQDWPDDVKKLATSLAAELFLVRYNPFVDPESVRRGVERRFYMARPVISGEYPKILAAAIEEFWKQFDADQAFKKSLVERLEKILPRECIGRKAKNLIECATDSTDLRMELPMLVLFPETEEQICSIVKLAGEMNFGLIPRGGGTGLTGGAIPATGRTVILSLSRFKKILDIDTGNMTLRAQAGVITLDAIQAADKRGTLFTVDPASKAASSLGGNVSENSGGPFAFEYGTTIDNVLSYRMVRPDGEVIEISRKDHPRHKIFENEDAVFEISDKHGKLLDTVSLGGLEIRAPGLGKDVSNKYLGGLPGIQKEGVDGIITEATFTLYPKPEHSRTLCLEFYGRSMHNAMLVIKDVVRLRDKIRAEGDLVKISALEEFGPKYVQAIEYQKKSQAQQTDPISVLLLQLDSDDMEALNRAVDTIITLAQPYEGVEIFAARDQKEAELFWEDRHKLSAIAKRTSGFKINEDIVIPLEVIPEFALFLEDLNLIYLAKAFRRALLQIRDLPGLPFEDPDVDAAIEEARAILKRKITSRDLSDVELEERVTGLIQKLRDRYPKLDREINALHVQLLEKRIVIANHMHAGDGNCHVNFPVNSNDPEMLAQAHEAADEVFKKVLELGGEVSGEHGIGVTKIAYLSEEKIKALSEYKKRIDPKDILNPAKLTRRKLPSEPFTFSFNRLIQDLNKTALKDKEELVALLRNIQTCTRCGKCKQVCPMFHPQSGLMFHPRNKNISLGALIEAIFYSQIQGGEPAPELMDELRSLMEHCTACGKCMAVCPVKIDSAGAALRMRAFLDYKGQAGHPVKTTVLHTLAKDPNGRLPTAAKLLSVGQSLQSKSVGLIPGIWRRRMTSPIFRSATPGMDFVNLIQELKLDQGSVFKQPQAKADETVLYFPGCGAGLFSRSIGMASLYLLLKSGANVVMPDKHLCCGYPLLASGCMEAYKTNRHRTMQDIFDLLVKTGKAGLMATTLLTACGTCRESLESFPFEQELTAPLKHLDVVQYLLERMDAPLPNSGDVIYHAACHTEWVDMPKTKAAEAYRSALAGLLESSVTLSQGCCGESGLGAMTSPEIYNKLRERKKEQLAADLEGSTKSRPVLVGCPSCKVGIKRGLMEMRKHNPVMHTVEYVAERVGGRKWKRELKKMVDKAERKKGVVLL